MKTVQLIFFLDAVRFDDINPVDTPFLYETARKGVFGPLQTILGYDGIAPTIFTGTYPDVHGVWTQHLLAGEDGPYRWLGSFSPFLEKADLKIEDAGLLEKAFRFALLKASLVSRRRTFYPGINKVPLSALSKFDFSMKRNLYEKGAFGSIPTLFDMLAKKDISYTVVDHQAFRNDQKVVDRALRIKDAPEVIYIRLMDLDETSHSYGVFSRERKAGLKSVDGAVQRIFSHFKGIGSEPLIILFADHGFMNVTRFLDVVGHIRRNGLPQDDFTVFLDSTIARFWADDSTLNKISRILSNLKMGRVLEDTDLQRYHVPKSPAYGNLIYLVDPGEVILPNFYQGDAKVLAMHGYAPDIPDMHTVFLVYGGGIVARRVFDTRLVDVLPTILDTLGIAKPCNCPGVSKLKD